MRPNEMIWIGFLVFSMKIFMAAMNGLSLIIHLEWNKLVESLVDAIKISLPK